MYRACHKNAMNHNNSIPFFLIFGGGVKMLLKSSKKETEIGNTEKLY
jgi:hypothetical protein